MEVVNAGPAAS